MKFPDKSMIFNISFELSNSRNCLILSISLGILILRLLKLKSSISS